jgi:glycosyltransferase involved in cell wall biosynthesis
MNIEARKIIMLANSGHPPLDPRIFLKESRTLKASGYDVTLIIPYTKSFAEDGIIIQAVSYHKKGFGKLVINPVNVFLKALAEPSSGIFHIHDSELLGIGLLLKVLGRRVIYDAHEDTPEQISYQHWIPGILKRPYTWLYIILEKLAGRFFDAIIVAEPIIARYFPKEKTVLIRNFPLASVFKEKAVLPFTQRSGLVYAGLLSKVRGLNEMLEGARTAQQKSTFRFVLCGNFAPASLQAETLSSYDVDHHSWLPYPKLMEVLFSSRVGIIIPHPIERYKTNYPVKLFEYMAAGMPVVASVFGEASQFVKEADAGILVDPMNSDEVANAISLLMTDDARAETMGNRGRNLIFSKYNWEVESVKLLELYRSLND